MLTIDQQIARTQEKKEQLIRQKKLQERKEKQLKIKEEKRRCYIIGNIFSNIFPYEVTCFKPQSSNMENEKEFMPLINLLSELADDLDYITKLKSKTGWDSLTSNKV